MYKAKFRVYLENVSGDLSRTYYLSAKFYWGNEISKIDRGKVISRMHRESLTKFFKNVFGNVQNKYFWGGFGFEDNGSATGLELSVYLMMFRLGARVFVQSRRAFQEAIRLEDLFDLEAFDKYAKTGEIPEKKQNS